MPESMNTVVTCINVDLLDLVPQSYPHGPVDGRRARVESDTTCSTV